MYMLACIVKPNRSLVDILLLRFICYFKSLQMFFAISKVILVFACFTVDEVTGPEN